MPQEYGLHRLATPELKRLLRALHRGALPEPITRSGLIEKAFGHIEADLDLVVGRDVAAAKALVVAVLNERDGVRGQGTAFSYCGVPTPGTRSRDLVDQVRELAASATQSIHLYGLRIADDRGLLRTVASLMSGRDVRVRLVFDSAGDADAASLVQRYLSEQLGAHRAELLEAYVSGAARLRARVVVVDEYKVLVGSGDLSAGEEDLTIDFGAQFSDATYCRALGEEWARMVQSGVVVPVVRAS